MKLVGLIIGAVLCLVVVIDALLFIIMERLRFRRDQVMYRMLQNLDARISLLEKE